MAEVGDRKYRSLVGGTCRYCEQKYAKGEWIIRLSIGRFAHVECLSADLSRRVPTTTRGDEDG